MDIQLIVLKPIGSSIYVPRSNPGDVVWVKTEEAARHLIEHGLCALPPENAQKPEPGDVLPKSAGEADPGRSTASPSSKERGPVRRWFASAAALVSPRRI